MSSWSSVHHDDVPEECTICIQSEVRQSDRCFGCEPSDFGMLATECDRLASVPRRYQVHVVGRRIDIWCIWVCDRGQKGETGWHDTDLLAYFPDERLGEC